MLVTNTKRKVVVLSILIGIACAAVYGLYFMIQRTVRRISSYESEARVQAAQLNADASLKDLIEDTSQDIDRLNQRIVSSEGTVGFIERVESLARDQNLTIVFDSVKEEVIKGEEETFELIKLSFATEGTWRSTHHFLELIEALPFRVAIQSVGLTQAGEGTGSSSPRWNGAFSIDVLKYK